MLKLLNIYLNHFPRHEKYALCTRMRATAYGLYDLITEGQKRYHKKTTLTQMDIAHEQLRMQIRLAHELGYFAFKDGKASDNLAHELGYFGFRDGAGKESGSTRAKHRGLNRFQQINSGIRPTFAVGPRQSLVIDTRHDSPVFGEQGAPAKGQDNVAPVVPQLLGTQHPSAVIRAIISVVVDTVKRVLRGGWRPHVGQESSERHPPFCAYRDASSAVIVVTGVFRVFASLNHATPAMVKRVIASRLRCFALRGRSRARFFAQAPA